MFQLCAELHSLVDVHRLNYAITRTAPYFPAMMVQRKTSMWDDWLESCDTLPKVVYWPNLPRYFCDMERLSQCAVQILYDQTHIAVVFSHYVTDGSGGCAFLNICCMNMFRVSLHRKRSFLLMLSQRMCTGSVKVQGQQCHHLFTIRLFSCPKAKQKAKSYQRISNVQYLLSNGQRTVIMRPSINF